MVIVSTVDSGRVVDETVVSPVVRLIVSVVEEVIPSVVDVSVVDLVFSVTVVVETVVPSGEIVDDEVDVVKPPEVVVSVYDPVTRIVGVSL